MAKAKTAKSKTTKVKAPTPKPYPEKPTAAEREVQFDEPPAEMPEALTGAPKAAEAPPETDAKKGDEEEQSWADVVKGASPDQWQVMGPPHAGEKTAGGPIKHSLCPGCIHLQKDDTCGGPMNEDRRNNPETIGCVNARRIDGQHVS